jgi:hypothetical protein
MTEDFLFFVFFQSVSRANTVSMNVLPLVLLEIWSPHFTARDSPLFCIENAMLGVLEYSEEEGSKGNFYHFDTGLFLQKTRVQRTGL